MATQQRKGSNSKSYTKRERGDSRLDLNDKNNGYLFRDEDSYFKYHEVIDQKKIATCFHALHPELNPKIYDEMRLFAEFWSFQNLLDITDPVFVVLTKLFYANTILSTNKLRISTWLGGNEVTITRETLCEWFGFNNDQNLEKLYLGKNAKLDNRINFDHDLFADGLALKLK